MERVEKLPYPVLVGSSVKSADDSPHNNYIHPEKYTGTRKPVQKKNHSLLNTSIGASLDDLISEGALLNSEEGFERFMDYKGNVRPDAKYLPRDENDNSKLAPFAKTAAPIEHATSTVVATNLKASSLAVAESVDSTSNVAEPSAAASSDSIGGVEFFSTPNLSEYQLGHQISDHSDLLESVKSYNLSKLPSSDDSEAKSKSNNAFGASERVSHNIRPSTPKGNHAFAKNRLEFGDNVNVVETDSMHSPFFQRDDRPSSRSRFPVSRVEDSRSISRDRDGARTHLARGDSYKNTHDDLPSNYELPADLTVIEPKKEDSRESRQTRPTLGESVAAAEAEIRKQKSQSVTRDPSLVTSGDYTNFNADGDSEILSDENLYSVPFEASANYLRLINRSRSRQPGRNGDAVSHLMNDRNEKNDSDPAELVNEGAYVNDDPYSQVDGLDDMMKKVLSTSHATTNETSQKNLVNDLSTTKNVTETKKQFKSDPAEVAAEKGNESEEKNGQSPEDAIVVEDFAEEKGVDDKSDTKIEKKTEEDGLAIDESAVSSLSKNMKEKAEEVEELSTAAEKEKEVTSPCLD